MYRKKSISVAFLLSANNAGEEWGIYDSRSITYFFTVFVTIFYGSFAINNFLWSVNHYLGPNPPIITVDNIARFAVISMLVIFSAITIGNVIHGTKKA